MRYEIPFRVVVTQPMAGVAMAVQKGKHELLPPTRVLNTEIRFEFGVEVELAGEALNFLGEYVQGPKDTRFLYVNSGEYAGQAGTCWARRAKLPLMMITREQIQTTLKHRKFCLQTVIPGVGSDGGPICASVKTPEWKVVEK